jgi:hypothetical protein
VPFPAGGAWRGGPGTSSATNPTMKSASGDGDVPYVGFGSIGGTCPTVVPVEAGPLLRPVLPASRLTAAPAPVPPASYTHSPSDR